MSASLPLAAASCNDEPITVSEPTETPPGGIDYQDLLREYFEEQGLSDAEAIGNHHAQFQRLSPTQAFDATAATRALIDASVDIEHALTALDQRVLDDFVELQLVDVVGWTLSHTEVDLCMLAWLG
ncbi:MAG TPA: hypothetical protein VI197_06705 [Polyangiaceae bacterium]